MHSRPVVLITGASRGLGRSLAESFSKAGYAVGINYNQNEAEAKKTADLTQKNGAESLLIKADVSKSGEAQKMIEAVMKKWGRLDILVNNAGLVHNALISKMKDEAWRDVMAVNLDAAFYTMRGAIPIMRDQKGGAIINMASYAVRGLRGAANYAAAKAGLVALTKSAAIEEGPFNIRVNAVMPGFHVTDMNTDVWKKFEENIRSQHLLKEMPKKEEMADFVVKISELKSVTGQVFSFESRLV